MTGWLFGLGWNWLLFPALAWVLRGAWRAWQRPHLTYRSHAVIPTHGTLLTVARQERLPLWRTREETWLLSGSSAARESDGVLAKEALQRQLRALLRVVDARATEIAILSDENAPLQYAVLSFSQELSVGYGRLTWSKVSWHAEEHGATRWLGTIAEAKVIASQRHPGREFVIVAVVEGAA